MNERWITFDLDGTLMQNPFVEWVFPEIEEIVSTVAKRKIEVKNAMFSEHINRMKQNKSVEAYDWDNILVEFLHGSGIDCEVNIEELVKKHSVSPKIKLLETNVIEILNQLKKSGYRLAVITNGHAKYQLPVVEHLQLSGLFDYFITPEKGHCAKPNIKIIESLMKKGKVVAHVGDRIDHDVYLAAQINIKSVFIYRDLPKQLQNSSPFERNKDPIFLELYKHKWQKETGTKTSEIPNLPIPDIVIYSIRELIDVL